ncbi:MAG: DHA2 family efflux MFS transporter permease subunit [SAR324 cluster bacterium]|nr:DHA2 family efflux MFS transporter permease subunit [SAR324 cluster bacterium]
MTEALPTPEVNRWILLIVVMVGTFLSILDSIVMNVAFPYIITSFGSNVEQVKWVSTGFMIAATCTMPLTPWLGRRIGYGSLYIISLAVFTIGSAGSAASWDLDSLIFFRFVQGAAAGTIQPASIVLLTRAFPPYIRGRAFGIWSVGVMLAPSLGPTVGGLLIEYSSWRAIFSMSLGIGVVALVLAMAILSRTSDEEPQPFDFMGYLALVVFLVAGLVTLSFGQQEGWTSGIILLGAAVAVTAFMLFLLVEADAEYPIVPLRLFLIPDFALVFFLTLYKSLVRIGGGFLLPIFLYQVQGRESFQIGLLMMPGAVLNTIVNPFSGWLTDRFGGRWPTFVGGFCIAYSLYLYHSVDALTSIWLLLYPQLFRAVGISLIDTPVVTTGMNSVTRDDAGYASWLINLSQRVGGVLTVSMLSTLLHRETSIHKDYLGGSALANRPPSQFMIRRGMAMGYSSIEAASLAKAAFGRAIGKAATTLAFQNLYFMMALAALTCVVPAYFLNRFRSPGKVRAKGMN